MLGPVADIQLSAPTEHEEKDVDLVEERKILFFLEAICGFKSIGVELAGNDVMDLEKWPLIQVYGIEELGGVSAPTLAGACMMVIAVLCRLMCALGVFGAGRGFFTMRHKVQDVGPALKHIYLQLDAHAVQELITYLPKISPYCLQIALFCWATRHSSRHLQELRMSCLAGTMWTCWRSIGSQRSRAWTNVACTTACASVKCLW